jgi:hypothetical protein
MRKVIYSLAVSLDGYIVGSDGKHARSASAPELHGLLN